MLEQVGKKLTCTSSDLGGMSVSASWASSSVDVKKTTKTSTGTGFHMIWHEIHKATSPYLTTTESATTQYNVWTHKAAIWYLMQHLIIYDMIRFSRLWVGIWIWICIFIFIHFQFCSLLDPWIGRIWYLTIPLKALEYDFDAYVRTSMFDDITESATVQVLLTNRNWEFKDSGVVCGSYSHFFSWYSIAAFRLKASINAVSCSTSVLPTLFTSIPSVVMPTPSSVHQKQSWVLLNRI